MRRPDRSSRPSAALVALPAAGLVAAVATAWLASAATVLAHGGVVPTEPPTLATLLFGWSFDPLVWLPAIVAVLVWRFGVRRVNRAHPANPVAPKRTWSWLAGVAVLLVALDSGIATYDTTLFWVHMIQHLLLVLVVPPLLLYAGPIVLILRASSPATRRRWILPVLHSRPVRFLSFPVVSWLLFAGVMWASHFSPLFNVALENDWAHRLEHGLYLFAALLFWWPVVGPDPSPWRLRPSARVLYVGLQMPQNTFLALAIYMAASPLYPHYTTTGRTWGPTPLEDQQIAGGIMWLGGDLLFLAAIIGLVYAWIKDDERRAVGEDRRLEGERARIRDREVILAARRAAESGFVAGVPGPDAGSAPAAAGSAPAGHPPAPAVASSVPAPTPPASPTPGSPGQPVPMPPVITARDSLP